MSNASKLKLLLLLNDLSLKWCHVAVWLQLLAIRAFVTPALQLLEAHPRCQSIQASLTAWAVQLLRNVTGKSEREEPEPEPDSCKAALEVFCSLTVVNL